SLARYCSGLRVSADRAAWPGPRTPRQLPAFRYTKEKSSERRTVCWSEQDSNLYGAFPVKSCFWFVAGSLFGAGKPFLVRSPAIRFAERAEGVKGPKH